MTKRINELRAERNELSKNARHILDNNKGALSTEEQTNIQTIYDKIDSIDKTLGLLERQAQLDGDEADVVAKKAEALGVSVDQASDIQARYSKAFKNFVCFGERGLSQDDITTLYKTNQIHAAQSGQQANGAQGGYLVPNGWGGKLIEALQAFGGVRSVATVIQTEGGNPIPFPTVDETAQEGEIVAESTTAASQDITFGTTTIGAYKYSSKAVVVPFELLQDQGPGMDVEQYIRRALADRIARITNKHYTTGTGTSQPRGVVTAAASGKVAASGNTTTVTYDDLVDLEHSVDPAYRASPSVRFMLHDTSLRNLKKLKDTQGRPIWVPEISGVAPNTLLGYQYTVNQNMPVMAANAKSILFGDFSQYIVRDVMNVTLFRFEDSAYVTKGQIGFLAWFRGDGNLVTAGQPIKYLQNSAS